MISNIHYGTFVLLIVLLKADYTVSWKLLKISVMWKPLLFIVAWNDPRLRINCIYCREKITISTGRSHNNTSSGPRRVFVDVQSYANRQSPDTILSQKVEIVKTSRRPTEDAVSVFTCKIDTLKETKLLLLMNKYDFSADRTTLKAYSISLLLYHLPPREWIVRKVNDVQK